MAISPEQQIGAFFWHNSAVALLPAWLSDAGALL
jgi:hypothetical protein